jgi:hypothetical protein
MFSLAFYFLPSLSVVDDFHRADLRETEQREESEDYNGEMFHGVAAATIIQNFSPGSFGSWVS